MMTKKLSSAKRPESCASRLFGILDRSTERGFQKLSKRELSDVLSRFESTPCVTRLLTDLVFKQFDNPGPESKSCGVRRENQEGHHCGAKFNNAYCNEGRYCSVHGMCGGRSTHWSRNYWNSNYRYHGKYLPEECKKAEDRPDGYLDDGEIKQFYDAVKR